MWSIQCVSEMHFVHNAANFFNSQGCKYSLPILHGVMLWEVIFFSAWPKLQQGKFSLEQVRCCQGLIYPFLFSLHKMSFQFTKACIQTLKMSLAAQKTTKNTSLWFHNLCMLWNLPLHHDECYNLQTVTFIKIPTWPSTSVSRHHVHPCTCYFVECESLKFPAKPTLSPSIEK
jgi:hypothetical protein